MTVCMMGLVFVEHLYAAISISCLKHLTSFAAANSVLNFDSVAFLSREI